MTTSLDLTATRALNIAKREHPATYCALRMFLDSIDEDRSNVWLSSYLRNRAHTDRYQEYRNYWMYKATLDDSQLEYRQCLVPSPTSLLMEIQALSVMASARSFQPHVAVYSYLWADADASHVYAPFIDGYARRDREIADACMRVGSRACVVVADIKNFYRKIPMDALARTMRDQIALSNFSRDDQALVAFVVDSYFTSWRRKDGVPIGPPMGHLLAQTYLRSLDDRLYEQFAGRYFRYVDDIIVVCESDAEVRVRKAIATEVERLGLALNDEKNDVVSGEEWIEHAASTTAAESDPFEKIRGAVRVWSDRISDNTPLENALRDVGVRLPIIPLRTRPPQWFTRVSETLLSQGFKLALPRLVKDIVRVRTQLSTRLDTLASESTRTSGAKRKWQLQGLRFTSNRLLYLAPEQQRAELSEKIPAMEELRPLRATANAVQSGDATGLLNFSGPTIATASRLWLASKRGPMRIDANAVKTEQQRQSLFDLWVFGAVEPDAEIVARMPSDKRFASFCAGVKATARPTKKFSYLDEIESLQMTSPESCAAKLRTRHTKHEDVGDDMRDLFS